MNRTPPDIGDLIAMAVCLPIVLAWFLLEQLMFHLLKGRDV